MRILVVSSWFPSPPDNGSKLRAYHLLAQLAARHEVTLLSFAEAGEGERASAVERMCAAVHVVRGNPFKPRGRLATLDLFGATPRSFRQTYSSEMQHLVDQAIAGADAAVAFEVGAAVYFTRHSALPRVLDEVETTVIRDRFRNRPFGTARVRAGLTWWKFSRFIRALVASFDRSTVVSALERERLLAIGCDPESVEVVPNGVDEAALLEPNTPGLGRMIYAGSLTYSPNYEAVQYFVDDILPRIHVARPDAHLTVTGDVAGVDLGPLSRPGVTFTGRLPDVRGEVTGSAVSVVPLKTGGGTRLKILEALALGTPVVSTSKGAEGLDVTPGEDILIGDTPQAFAAQVIRVLGDVPLRRHLAANGRRLVGRTYTWTRIGTRFDDVLQAAIGVHAARSRTVPLDAARPA